MPICSRCKQEKPVDAFFKRSDRRIGRHSACKDCMYLAGKSWRKANRARHRELGAKRLRKERQEALEHYGSRCICCGEKHLVMLAFDHVNNDGYERRKAGEPYGSELPRWLKRHGWPKDFQLLCHNCNMAKSILGECPHETEKELAVA